MRQIFARHTLVLLAKYGVLWAPNILVLPMKYKLFFLSMSSALSLLGADARAQDIYGGVGFPGLMSLGYAKPMAERWGVRGEYASGLNMHTDGDQDGITMTGSIKASRAGAFADWFPFGGGFRLVGGVTFNDIKASMNGVGSPNSKIQGVTVDTTGKTFNVELVYPSTTPYLGIGYGHQATPDKGLGFFADLGVMYGSFNVNVTQNLVSTHTQKSDGTFVTQADIDAQTQSIRDSANGQKMLPNLSIGLTYRY